MHPKSLILPLVIFLLRYILSADETSNIPGKAVLIYPSPNKKWAVVATWISDTYRYDWKVKNLTTGKSYLGLEGLPESNAIGCKYLSVVWSPDSHYAAINCSVGRIIEEICLVSTSGKEPVQLEGAWEDTLSGNETFELALLRERDKKRFDGWKHLWVSTSKWLTDSDLLLEADMGAQLKATPKKPKEFLELSALITVHIDKTGKGRIVRGRYAAYKKIPQTD